MHEEEEVRRIIKNESPVWFEDWKRNFAAANGRRASYKKDFPQEKKRKLRENLLKEQGSICCYCMSYIDIDHSHLEHFRPKDQFPSEDMDYENMLASCEGIISGPDEDHCGHRKNNWYSPYMVSPSHSDIETMFHYTPDGMVHPAGRDHLRAAAREMIHHLGLDSYHLVRNREAAIEASGFFDSEYTEDEIWDMIDYYSNLDNGTYIPYCGAIADVWRSIL